MAIGGEHRASERGRIKGHLNRRIAQPNAETSNNSAPRKTNGQNADAPLPPHFRVPIVDKFNYANVDCSVQVHTTHKSASSGTSIPFDQTVSPCRRPVCSGSTRCKLVSKRDELLHLTSWFWSNSTAISISIHRRRCTTFHEIVHDERMLHRNNPSLVNILYPAVLRIPSGVQ